jgi:copper(I)-binding protein
MRCEYNDGLKVSYSGTLRINNGSDVNVYLAQGEIPSELQGELHDAEIRHSCSEMRDVAQKVTDVVGDYLPE